MKKIVLKIASGAVLAVVVFSATAQAQASERYWRVSPSYLAPAPHTYGPVMSPPPFHIYSPAPVVYVAPIPPVHVESVPVTHYHHGYSYGYHSDYHPRHGRSTHKVDVHDSHGGRMRYRYKVRNGRVRVKARYRP